MCAINHKKRAIVTFVAYHALYFIACWVLTGRSIFYQLRYQTPAPLPLDEWIMIALIFAVVVMSAFIMHYIYHESTKANLKWLRIVSRIQEVIYWAMLPVGGLGLLIGAMAL